jgi:hypothetical protein
MTLEEAQRVVHERMAHRQENLIRILAQNIYNDPRSPYLALLQSSA